MSANNPNITLDYTMCTPSELRGFIKDRVTLTPEESDMLNQFRKSHLVAHLQALDQSMTFRFLDLPPELRLEVYRHILIGRNREVLEAPDQAIETAILRTCNLIYHEAEPVLYCENDFSMALNINNDEDEQFLHQGTHMTATGSTCANYHYLAIARPGHHEPDLYSHDDDEWCQALSSCMATSSCFDMLRRARHL